MKLSRFLAVLPAIALVAASALVVLLSWRVQTLNSAYWRLSALSVRPHAGMVVPTFRAATLSGDSVTVGEGRDSSAAQVLFVFNIRCPYCRQTLPLWKRLADSLGRLPRPAEVIGISLDSAEATSRYLSEHGVPFRVVNFPAPKLARLYRATSVPQTIVLDYRGTVAYARTGLLEPPKVLDSVYRAVALVRRDSALVVAKAARVKVQH